MLRNNVTENENSTDAAQCSNSRTLFFLEKFESVEILWPFKVQPGVILLLQHLSQGSSTPGPRTGSGRFGPGHSEIMYNFN